MDNIVLEFEYTDEEDNSAFIIEELEDTLLSEVQKGELDYSISCRDVLDHSLPSFLNIEVPEEVIWEVLEDLGYL